MKPRTQFLMAIRNNNSDVVAGLFPQFDPAEELEPGKTAMQVAYAHKSKECIRAIAKDKRPNAAIKGRYGDILLSLINDNDIKTARILLESGAATIWYCNNNHDNGIHRAVRNNNKAMLTMLLSFDYDLTQENNEKLTPIQLASNLGHTECIRIIAKNRKTDAKDKARYGDSLLIATIKNDIETARILLEAGGAAVAWQNDTTKETGPFYAVRNNNPEMVALLLEFNCNFERTNNLGQTPQQLGDTLPQNTALAKGWQMHYDAQSILIKEMFLWFIVSIRQQGIFSKLPSTLLEYIGSFAYQQSSSKMQTVKSTYNAFVHQIPERVARISAQKLILEFHKASRWHSAESRTFIKKLENDLKKEDCTRAHIYRRTTEFLETPKGKKETDETRGLIAKYNLTTFPPVQRIPKSQATPIKKTYQSVTLCRKTDVP